MILNFHILLNISPEYICFSLEFGAQLPSFTAVMGKVKNFLGVLSEANKRLELDAKVCI